MLKTVYGIDVAEEGDRIIEVIDTAMEGVSVALTPGAFLVEYLPFLRHIPEWLPGAGFQKRLRRWRDASHEMVEMPFAQAKAAMVRFFGITLLVFHNRGARVEGRSPDVLDRRHDARGHGPSRSFGGRGGRVRQQERRRHCLRG